MRAPRAGEAPGTIIDQTNIAIALFPQATATRIGYVVAAGSQTNTTSETGVVLRPVSTGPVKGLVVIGHQSAGVGDQCAPSTHAALLKPMSRYIAPLLEAGFAVAIPDYAGLGSPGPHPYLVGSLAGNSIIGILEPAREVANVAPDAALGAIGFSQGGQAVLFASTQAKFVAVAAVSPVADTLAMFDRPDEFPAAGLLATLVGHQQANPNLALREVLTTKGLGATQRLAGTCDLGSIDLGNWADLIVANVLTAGAWNSALRADSAALTTPRSPTLLVRGESDPVFTADDEAAVRDTWCSTAPGEVFRLEIAGADHGATNTQGGPLATAWLLDRLGEPSSASPAVQSLCY